MRAALWGIEHTRLGEVAVQAVGDRAAVGITRGLHAKHYRYTDPNEDAVAAVAGPRATLLICADGHNGAASSHVAVEEVLGALGDDPPPALDDQAWIDLFARVNDAVIERRSAGDAPQPSSNTVLLVALASAERLSWASLGDAALVVARPGSGRGRQLNRERMRFAGYPMDRAALAATVDRGTESVAGDEWVVLASDGLSEFIAPLRPADLLPRLLAATADGGAVDVARKVIDVAGQAGAGDNVAVAVLAPGTDAAQPD